MGVENNMSKKSYGLPPISAQPHPWLVICHGNNMQKQTFFSISKDLCDVTTIPELRKKKILAYAHEWLVLLDIDSKDCYIWNRISMEKIQLPPLPVDVEYDNMQCLLSAPPHDPECHVVFLCENSYVDDEVTLSSLIYFCKPGHNQEFHMQDLQFIANITLESWTIFKGKVYGVACQTSSLVILDLDHESGIVQVIPLTNQPIDDFGEFIDMPCSQRYLIQSCDNDLLYVRVLYFGMDLMEVYGCLVFRFDFAKKSWVKVNRIGEIAIFLGDCWGTSCSTKGTNVKGESIYFIGGSIHLYVFNLKTQSISVSLPCPRLSRMKSMFNWLML